MIDLAEELAKARITFEDVSLTHSNNCLNFRDRTEALSYPLDCAEFNIGSSDTVLARILIFV